MLFSKNWFFDNIFVLKTHLPLIQAWADLRVLLQAWLGGQHVKESGGGHLSHALLPPLCSFFFFLFCLLSTFTRQVALFLANKVSIKYIWTWMFSYREPKQPILIRISKKLWEINEWYSLNEYIENITSQPTIWNLFGITNSSSCLMCNCYCSYSCIWGSAREQQCSRTLCTFHLCYKM